MQLRSADAVHALLLLIAVGLIALAVWLATQRRIPSAAGSLVVGAVFGWWYLASDTVPPQVTFVTPYVTTLLVLALASQRLRMPKADGVVYRRGTSQ
jgi:simple sugar transport system permease protein